MNGSLPPISPSPTPTIGPVLSSPHFLFLDLHNVALTQTSVPISENNNRTGLYSGSVFVFGVGYPSQHLTWISHLNVVFTKSRLHGLFTKVLRVCGLSYNVHPTSLEPLLVFRFFCNERDPPYIEDWLTQNISSIDAPLLPCNEGSLLLRTVFLHYLVDHGKAYLSPMLMQSDQPSAIFWLVKV